MPVLQIVNLLFGLLALALDWPLAFVAGSAAHRSIELRLVLLPLFSLAAALLYQATNPALYYLAALAVYFWSYADGEAICASPWQLPDRAGARLEKV